jgi:putative transposase
MRKSRFSDQQIALALQQVEHGASVAEVCRKLEIAEQTYYRWKKKFGEMAPSEIKKLKQLEDGLPQPLRSTIAGAWTS